MIMRSSPLNRPFFRPWTPKWQQPPPLKRRLAEAVRSKIDGARRCQGVHQVGLDQLHNTSADEVTFFDSRRRQSRSQQLPTSITSAAQCAPRRRKKVYVSLQSRGQVGQYRAADGGNRIFSVGDVRWCCSFDQWDNFVSRPPTAQLPCARALARICRWTPQCAARARTGDCTLSACVYGTRVHYLRTLWVSVEACAACCHSVFGLVWDQKKGRCKA